MEVISRLLDLLRHRLADTVDYIDQRRRRLLQRQGWGEPKQLVAYRAYANLQSVWVQGRLLANRIRARSKDDPNWWDNLRETFERFSTHEVPDAGVTLQYLSQTIETTTDEEGYFRGRFDLESTNGGPVLAQTTGAETKLFASHPVVHLDESAQVMLISDMDDTVIQTGISDLLQAARLTFLNNAKTRKPLAGAASLYQEISRAQGADSNPVFYLSNSPWNLYDLLDDFLKLNDFPVGPLLLRDVGIRAAKVKHKPATLRLLMQRFSHLPVILIGDSGEHDASYYAEVAEMFPGRVMAIYIRDVDPSQESARDQRVDGLSHACSQHHIPFLRVENSIQIAESLIKLSVLDAAALSRVTAQTNKDLNRASLSPDLRS